MISRFTFLDFLCGSIIAVSTGFALTKGLAREIISLFSLGLGFILAVYGYRRTSLWFINFTRTESMAQLLGFLTIFLGVILLGALMAYMVNRWIKIASMEWIDRILGGIFGFLRGWAVASIIVMALIAFPVRENLVGQSIFAPYLLAGARGAALIVPKELKDRFYKGYKKVLEVWNDSRDGS